ncbi:hypothetical protein Vadar_019845 [Vaccinium darrowii]|uniref:Uncharacterized protein n=1 Tax=Vaccinium darrowii TaxID=229202 RepID=A0ACB7XTB9_9ERIC|nr:hypothetical protein Vadar_019845 [Vaccinium darrowii]
MWFHLRRHKAPRGRHPNEYKVPVGGTHKLITSPDEADQKKKISPDEADQKETPADKKLKSFINTMALVAALIATLTFAAAFTMPGGYNNSPANSGVATLVKKTALKVFILSDTLAMCCTAAPSLLCSYFRWQWLLEKI